MTKRFGPDDFFSEGLAKIGKSRSCILYQGITCESGNTAQVGARSGLPMVGWLAKIGAHESVQVAWTVKYTGRKSQIH
jgi:hypothetical protein